VHNSASGLYSIARKDKSATKTIAAGGDTFIAGLIDALAGLEKADLGRILFVYANDLLPERYTRFLREDETQIALALLLSRDTANGNVFSIRFQSGSPQNRTISQEKEFLRFFLSDARELHMQGSRMQCIWSKCD
jgi:hypothetical protein